MKRFDLSRAGPLALSLALSLAMSFAVGEAIAAQGMKAAAALEASRHVAQPLLARSHRARIADIARTRAS